MMMDMLDIKNPSTTCLILQILSVANSHITNICFLHLFIQHSLIADKQPVLHRLLECIFLSSDCVYSDLKVAGCMLLQYSQNEGLCIFV